MKWEEDKIMRDKETWEVMDMFTILTVVVVLCLCIHQNLYTLNIFSFLHVNYTSIKLYFKMRRG